MTGPVFVTGLSGAGLSSTLKIMEDLGFEAFDNFPLDLVDDLKMGRSDKPLAIGIDARTRGFSVAALQSLVSRLNGRLVFIACDESTLQRRFTETRRRHPLAADRPVSAGIHKEMELLYPLRELADPVIDTSDMTIHDLKRVINGLFQRKGAAGLAVTIQTFGFKNGLPRHADIVMDVRFLKNPHWNEALRPLTGLDGQVRSYVGGDPSFPGFVENFKNLLGPLLDRYEAEGKSYLTVALGCTGGKHRSVVVAEVFKDWLVARGVAATVDHRDIDRA